MSVQPEPPAPPCEERSPNTSIPRCSPALNLLFAAIVSTILQLLMALNVRFCEKTTDPACGPLNTMTPIRANARNTLRMRLRDIHPPLVSDGVGAAAFPPPEWPA